MRAAGLAVVVLMAGCAGRPATAPGPGPASIDEPGGLPAGYQLVWADEFEGGPLPAPARWAYDTHRNRQGWYNDEQQYYAAERADNARVDGGGQGYTSARLFTKGRASWTYGFFEIRAKLPCGRGTWPAVWTLADGGRWPDDGEIDIVEHVGFDPGVLHASVHTRAYHHGIHTQRTAKITRADACTNFHRYQLTWTPDRITVGVDDRAHFSFHNDGTGERSRWPFDRPQHLLLNIAVGGNWGGQRGIDADALPASMEVDYVRVYQRR